MYIYQCNQTFVKRPQQYHCRTKEDTLDCKLHCRRHCAHPWIELCCCTFVQDVLPGAVCQATSYGGTVSSTRVTVENIKPVKTRQIKVTFNADTGASMRWNFKPQQRSIKVFPGETALAFYTATNPTNRPVTGISTYNVTPFEAGQYFNKIQCFCFEEQQLNPHEQVDMPVFFYIDPEFTEDPGMEMVDNIILSYTFFESREGLKLPFKDYINPHLKPG